MAYDERGSSANRENQPFPAPLLVPASFLDPSQRYSLVVEPLYFREDQLGFILFEAQTENDEIYEILRGTISGAIKRTILTEGNLRLYHEALEAKRAAEEANLLKSRFLSMVSHELRTPLSLIVGTIEIMMREQTGGPTSLDRIHGDMETIHTSAQHLFRLIGDVLDLASSHAGELNLTYQPVNLTGVIDEVARLGEALAREKGLLWQAKIERPLPVILADRTRLRQVLLNLLSNAVKFTERGTVSLSAGVQEKEVVVTVSDTGMGIPTEELAYIFDEFRRSERSQARGYGGMGLGLAITRRLVELHGGTIEVRSSGEEEFGLFLLFFATHSRNTTSRQRDRLDPRPECLASV